MTILLKQKEKSFFFFSPKLRSLKVQLVHLYENPEIWPEITHFFPALSSHPMENVAL